MTPETSVIITKLRNLEALEKEKEELIKKFENQKAEVRKQAQRRQNDLKRDYDRQRNNDEKNIPVEPQKREIIPLSLGNIFEISKIKKQNEANKKYNESEYPRLVQIYKDEIEKRKEEIIKQKNEFRIARDNLQKEIERDQKLIEETQEKVLSDLDIKINEARHELPKNVDKKDVDSLIQLLEFEIVSTFEEACSHLEEIHCESRRIILEREFEQSQASFDDFSSNNIFRKYSKNDKNEHSQELILHNTEMERQRMQAEKERLSAEKREFENAKERERWDKMREEREAHQKAREERREIRHSEIAGMNKCSHCVNSAKCSIQAKYNSLNCGSYSPK